MGGDLKEREIYARVDEAQIGKIKVSQTANFNEGVTDADLVPISVIASIIPGGDSAAY